MKVLFRTLIISISICTLAGCASNSNAPKITGNQSIMFAAETQQAKHGLGTDDNLAAIRKDLSQARVIKSRPDHYLSLHFISDETHLNTKQKLDLTHLVSRLNGPKTYTAFIYAGPGNPTDGIKAALSAQRRTQAIRKQLTKKLNTIKTFYNPKLPVGMVIVEMIAGGSKAT